jgi:hypothetical protein
MPTANEAKIEEMIEERGRTAKRITPADIDYQIEKTIFHVFPGTTTTVCCLVLRNGYTVIGEGACASPENFDRAIGERVAYEDARKKIWALEGYLLRSKLAGTI